MKSLILTVALLFSSLSHAYIPNIKLKNGAYFIADTFSLNDRYLSPKVWIKNKKYPICRNGRAEMMRKLACTDSAKPYADFRSTTFGLFQYNGVLIHDDHTVSIVKCDQGVIFGGIQCVSDINQVGGE